MVRNRRRTPKGLLRTAPEFRRLWLSRSVSFTGDGVARIALVLLAADRGPGAVGLVLLVNTLPRLLGPIAGAVTDRVDQRRILAACELAQGALYAVLALTHPSLALLLVLVAAAGALATLGGPAGKSSVPRLVPADSLPAANALLGTAFNLQVLVGPALGGVLAGVAGTSVAFGLNAASFVVSAVLLRRLPPLPPESGGPPSVRGLLAESGAGIAYSLRNPVPRALALGTLVLVTFAAMDNVALVFLVEGSLHGSRLEYGVTVAAFGAGMLLASLALVRFAGRRPPGFWVLIATVAGAVGTVATGLAPAVGVALVGQAVAGAGNSAELVANDTIVQQQVPRALVGRVFGAVSTGAQLGSAIAYIAAGPLIDLTSARVTLVIAGAGALLGLLVLQPLWRTRSTSG